MLFLFTLQAFYCKIDRRNKAVLPGGSNIIGGVLIMALKYQRILLKISGEALGGEKGTGFDEPTMDAICGGVKKAHDLGVSASSWAAATSGAVVPAARWSAPWPIRSECWPR